MLTHKKRLISQKVKEKKMEEKENVKRLKNVSLEQKPEPNKNQLNGQVPTSKAKQAHIRDLFDRIKY